MIKITTVSFKSNICTSAEGERGVSPVPDSTLELFSSWRVTTLFYVAKLFFLFLEQAKFFQSRIRIIIFALDMRIPDLWPCNTRFNRQT